jgi:hypothetical protein
MISTYDQLIKIATTWSSEEFFFLIKLTLIAIV